MNKVNVYPVFIRMEESIFGIPIRFDTARMAAPEVAEGNEDRAPRMIVLMDCETNEILTIFYGNDEFVRKTVA